MKSFSIFENDNNDPNNYVMVTTQNDFSLTELAELLTEVDKNVSKTILDTLEELRKALEDIHKELMYIKGVYVRV